MCWRLPAFVAAAGPRSCLPPGPEEAARGATGCGEGQGMLNTLHFLAAGGRRVWFRMSGVCHLESSTGDKSLTNNGELMKNIPNLTRRDLCNLFFWSLRNRKIIVELQFSCKTIVTDFKSLPIMLIYARNFPLKNYPCKVSPP